MKAPLRGNHAVVTERFFIRAVAAEGGRRVPRRPAGRARPLAPDPIRPGGRQQPGRRGRAPRSHQPCLTRPAGRDRVTAGTNPADDRPVLPGTAGRVAGPLSRRRRRGTRGVHRRPFRAAPLPDMGRPFASFVFGIASHKVADACAAPPGWRCPPRSCRTARRAAGARGDRGGLPRGAAGQGVAGAAAGPPSRAGNTTGCHGGCRRKRRATCWACRRERSASPSTGPLARLRALAVEESIA